MYATVNKPGPGKLRERAEMTAYERVVRQQVEARTPIMHSAKRLELTNLMRRAWRAMGALQGAELAKTLGAVGAAWGRKEFTDEQIGLILRQCLAARRRTLSTEEGELMARTLRDASAAADAPPAQKAGRRRRPKPRPRPAPKPVRKTPEELESIICAPQALETFSYEGAVEAAAKAMCGMPDVSKRVVAERLVRRLKVAELVEQSGLREDTVKGILAEARRKLKRYTSYFRDDHWWTDDEAALIGGTGTTAGQ